MKISEFKRIIFYGCSYTAGQELSDHEFFTEMTFDEVESIKKSKGHDFYNSPRIDNDLLTKLNYEKSWARWFADELGLPWVNHAKPGSSLHEIIFTIETDLSNGFIEDDDLIIVGLTSSNRILTFDDNGYVSSLIFHDNDKRWKNDTFKKLFIKELANDYYLVYNWYINIKYLDLLSKKLNNRLYQQYIWATYDEQWFDPTFKIQIKEDFLKIVSSIQKFESIIDQSISFSSECHWHDENTHAFFHPKIHIHKQLAKKLAESFLHVIDKK